MKAPLYQANRVHQRPLSYGYAPVHKAAGLSAAPSL